MRPITVKSLTKTLAQPDYDRVLAWRDAHREHVSDLIDQGLEVFEPTGSDRGQPELWKAAHWRWFILAYS